MKRNNETTKQRLNANLTHSSRSPHTACEVGAKGASLVTRAPSDLHVVWVNHRRCEFLTDASVLGQQRSNVSSCASSRCSRLVVREPLSERIAVEPDVRLAVCAESIDN